MSYTKLQSDIPGQLRVQLDTGEHVEVSHTIEREMIANGAIITAYAVQLDPETGGVVTDAQGDPIHTRLSYNASAAFISALTLDRVVRQVLLALLGESMDCDPDSQLPYVPFSAEVLAAASIRIAIGVAATYEARNTGALL